MTIDLIAPVELPDFGAKQAMNEQFRKWVEQRRAELERGRSISELPPTRVARMLACGNVLCLPPDEHLRRRRTIAVDVVRHPKIFDRDRTGPSEGLTRDRASTIAGRSLRACTSAVSASGIGSELAILGPHTLQNVASIPLSHRVPAGTHGSWVPIAMSKRRRG